MTSDFFRVGAAAAMVGTVIGAVFNLLHPRSGTALADVEAELQLIADTGNWKLVHIMLAVAVAISAVGFIAIALSMANTPADPWARTAALFGSGASAVVLVLLALDGSAVKDLADLWARGNESVEGAATALVEINVSLLGVSWILLFGITPLLLGQALVLSGTYPVSLGYAETAGGVLGLVTGFLLLFETAASLTGTILIPLSSLIHTVVVFLAGWLLWQRAAAVGPVAHARATTKP